MKILSLFDGISCARVALEKAGIPVEVYYASEIDKYAIQIAQKNYPDTVQVGDIKTLRGRFDINEEFGNGIDLLIGGSPCQDLSIAKHNRKGLDGERSGLFWEYVRILREVNPKYFILENVASMSKESKQIITETLGVEPIMIDASLVSGQSRKRLFWTNIPNVTQPEDKGILLQDILEKDIAPNLKSYAIDANYYKGFNFGSNGGTPSFEKGKRQAIRIGDIGSTAQAHRVYSVEGKSVPLTALAGGQGAKTGLYALDKDNVRMLSPIECERLQGLKDNYTEGISNTQRYKCLGNAFNVDVIAHILSFIPN